MKRMTPHNKCKTFIDLFAGGGMLLGLEQMDEIRFINRKAFADRKNDGLK